MGFGKNLKAILFERDLTVAGLSRSTGIPASTLYSIIDKDIDTVGIDKVKKIEKAIGAIPGGVVYNFLYGIEPSNEVISTRQQDFYSIGNESREYWTLENYRLLNTKGQVKVAEYIEDMTKIEEYKKEK